MLEHSVITREPIRGGTGIFRFYDKNLNPDVTKELSPEKLLPGEMTLSNAFKIGREIYGLASSTNINKMLS